MNEQLLVDALTLDEQLAPDPADVLAGVADGIRRRRRRQLAGYAASALVLVIVAGLAAVAVPRLNERVAGPVLPATFERTLRFGWLPDHLTAPTYSASVDGESVQYSSVEGKLSVEASNLNWQPRLDHPGWRQVQVAGRPGRLVSGPTRTFVEWRLASGRWAMLTYEIETLSGDNGQPGIETVAERIAAGVTEGDPVPVRVAFGLTHLPPGWQITGVHGTSGDGYGLINVLSHPWEVVGTTEVNLVGGITVDRPKLAETKQFVVSLEPGDWEPGIGDRRAGSVHGNPAYLLSEGRGLAFNWPPHGTVQVNPTAAGVVSPDEFRAVASGVRWLGR
jgi:hypothetical protein